MSLDHPSEALLSTFEHNKLEMVMVPNPNVQHERTAQLVLGLGGVVSSGVVFWALSRAAMATELTVVMGAFALFAFGMIPFARRRIHLSLDPQSLTITRRYGSVLSRKRTLLLGDIRTVHAVDVPAGHGAAIRGLRIALQNGEELFLSGPLLPVSSLEWLATELRTVLERRSEANRGEVAPELTKLMSDASRRQLEVAHTAQRATRVAQ